MQAFEVNWLRWLLVMSVSGVVVAIAVYLGFYLPSAPGRPPSREQPEEEFAAGIRVTRQPIPPLLILLYIGVFIFLVLYTVYLSVTHINF